MEKSHELSQEKKVDNIKNFWILSKNIATQVQNTLAFSCPIKEIIQKRNENTFKQDDIVIEVDFDSYKDIQPGPDVDMLHKFVFWKILSIEENWRKIKTDNMVHINNFDHIYKAEEIFELLKNENFKFFNYKDYNNYSNIFIILKGALDNTIGSELRKLWLTIEEYFEIELLKKTHQKITKFRF